MVTPNRSHHGFFAATALLFVVSAAVTVAWCRAMAAMLCVPTAEGWRASTAWMRLPGQSWPEAAGHFMAMWIVMMVAMMLPALVPMLWRYRQAMTSTGDLRLAGLTGLVGLGYFTVWTAVGLPVYPAGAWLTAATMGDPTLAPAAPIVAGVVVLTIGGLQFTGWKARYLACCRGAPSSCHSMPASMDAAWRHGLRLGLRCCACCGGLMAALIVIGVMDLTVMAVITAAITAERLATAGRPVARIIGIGLLCAGVAMLLRGTGLG